MRNKVWATLLLSTSIALNACGDDEVQGVYADADGDGFTAPADCDDEDNSIFPGADEVPYDGIDQDCSGSDRTDVDEDGFDALEASLGSAGAAGATGDGGLDAWDCDDRRPDVNPAGVEICGDGIDQDCSGSDQSCDEVDRDRDGYSSAAGDCDDLDPAVGPHSDETHYNGVDDDCDPATNDGDQDNDGFSLWGGDCDDEDASVYPGANEVPYDGIDQDCSGSDDTDLDGDGVPGGPAGADCDDFDPGVRPGRDEVVADGIDQNCDGSDLAGLDDFKRYTREPALPASAAAMATGSLDGNALVLAAWADSRNAVSQDVYAQRLDEEGDPVGSEIEVVTGGLSKFDVRVAAHEDIFLVTWRTSEGVFGQLISAEGGRVAGDLPVGAAGGAAVDVSYGPDNFAVAWLQTNADPLEVRVRGVSVEGVRGDNNLVFAGAASAVAIASNVDEHMVFWTGDQGLGLFGRRVNGRGEPRGEVIAYGSIGPLGAIAATSFGAHYALALHYVGPVHSVRGAIVDIAGNILVGAERGVRLSKESLAIPRVAIGVAGDELFVGYEDLRHIGETPAVSAIYHNGFGEGGSTWFASDRAIHADVGVELGGVAPVGARLLVSSKNSSGLGVVPYELAEL